jgi:hypothetical protein
VGSARIVPEAMTGCMRPPRLRASALMPPGRGLSHRRVEAASQALPCLREMGSGRMIDVAAPGCQHPPASDAWWMIPTSHDRCGPGET